LRSEGQILVWEPHVPYTLDTAEFEAAVKAGALERAVGMYRGDLLPDCYGDWVMPERERLHQLHNAALQRLLEQAEDARDYTAALGYAQQLAREDPLCETHCRRLIHLQMLAGDRAGALRTYHACATLLRRQPASSTPRCCTGATTSCRSSRSTRAHPLWGARANGANVWTPGGQQQAAIRGSCCSPAMWASARRDWPRSC
jgi:hypothetical protein